MLIRCFACVRTRDLWQRHPHALLAHRPCPPVAHSIKFVVLFNSIWTSDASGSSGRSAAVLVDSIEKREPASLADSFANGELFSHDRVFG